MKILMYIAVVILILHGLIHLMGTVTYLKLGTLEGLSNKTTVLGGRADLGETGIRVFGILWAVAAIGFVLSAVALLVGSNWWGSVLVLVTGLSLILTLLDWNTAFTGAIVNIIILAVLWLGPYATTLFSR